MRGFQFGKGLRHCCYKGGGGSGGSGKGKGGGGGSGEVSAEQIATDANSPDEFDKTLSVGANEVNVFSLKSYEFDNALDIPVHELAFSVNGSMTVTQLRDNTPGSTVARNALKSIRRETRNWPDGQIIMNKFVTEDGKGNSRSKLYSSLGFGKPDSTGTQWAVVQGGKWRPLTRRQAETLANQRQRILDNE